MSWAARAAPPTAKPMPAARPTILIPFQPGQTEGSFAVIYVRPETNKIVYERAIVAGIKKHGQVVFAANLNGALFHEDRILEEHYQSQFRFARDPGGQMASYPEIAAAFEAHFKVPASRAGLLGSFEAIETLGISAEEMLGSILPEEDFLSAWGQVFKRIGSHYIVNPNLPAIVKLYTTEANVLTVVARCDGDSSLFFAGMNRAIYTEITSRADTPLIDADRLDSLVWSERVRRTYHLSTNHLMAMLDMSDLVYTDKSSRIDIASTPLGMRLVEKGVMSADGLRRMRQSRIAYLGSPGERRLEYLPDCAVGKDQSQVEALLQGA